MEERIELTGASDNGSWNPVTGEQAEGLLSSKGFADSNGGLTPAGNQILDETLRVLQACADPHVEGNDTGLVIGYVQSGKTLSFTTLAALAHDNEYQIVIVVAGTSTNLVDQSTKRLHDDLQIGHGKRVWAPIKNPQTQQDLTAIETVLQQWANPNVPRARCKTLLITVMKHSSHLRNLTDFLSRRDLTEAPTLIIDDEADQASLNTYARRAAKDGFSPNDLPEESLSITYRRLNDLRAILPRHTFLQYTATPQANLFINIMDRLSPNFIRLLTPGADYTGGIQFFRENLNLVEELPDGDVPSKDNELDAPPESLLKALRLFYLGVAAGQMEGGRGNRSMLVHPSRLQGEHNKYFRWVSLVKASWLRLFADSGDEDDRNSLLEDFRRDYESLKQTVGPSLPPFEKMIGEHELQNAIQEAQIVEVNTRAGKTPTINWTDFYPYILVGGQSMDRGFTVEGLTITYMPRDLGTSPNVDTVQQRARFFGYKRKYLGYCRVFLDHRAIEAYSNIIEHEENVRASLRDYDLNDRHLNQWDRRLMLKSMLKLTRNNILFDDTFRGEFGSDWVRIKAPHDTEFIQENLADIMAFLRPKENLFTVDAGHPDRTRDQRHLVAKLPLQDCLENLLNPLRFTDENDSAIYSMLRGIIQNRAEESPNEMCLVYIMSAQTLDDWKIRERAIKKDKIEQLFQGRNPKAPKPAIYPGDAEIKDPNTLTIQIHRVSLKGTDFNDVPTLAIWVPHSLEKDLVTQPSNRE